MVRQLVAFDVFVVVCSACAPPTGDDWPELGDPAECVQGDLPVALGAEPGARTLRHLASVDEIPGLDLMSTARGREIGTLHAFEGRIHFGYGDSNENTGPTVMVSYAPQEDAFGHHGIATSEEVLEFLQVGDSLFAADFDPIGHEAEGSVFRLDAPCGEWQTMTRIPGAVHTYAMVEFGGELFATTGSVLGEPALVMASADGGATWEERLAVESAADEFTRILDAGRVGDEVVVTGEVFPDGPVFGFGGDGAQEWTAIENVPDHRRLPVVRLGDSHLVFGFSGHMGHGGEHKGTYALVEGTFVDADPLPGGFGLTNWHLSSADAAAPARVWALGTLGSGAAVFASSDLENWELIAQLETPPAGSGAFSAIAYEANTVFLGTSEGDFMAVEEIFAPAP